MALIEKLKNKLGQIIFPETRTKAVYDDDGNRLDNVLKELIDDNDKLLIADISGDEEIEGEIIDATTLGGKYTSTDIDEIRKDIRDMNDKIGSSGSGVDMDAINALLDKKVDKEAGKGLSSNDFTDQYMQRLDSFTTTEIPNIQNDIANIEANKIDASDVITKDDIDKAFGDL